MIELKLYVTSSGYELQLPNGFMCRNFYDNYEDKNLLDEAVKSAIIDMFAANFDDYLDATYHYIKIYREASNSD